MIWTIIYNLYAPSNGVTFLNTNKEFLVDTLQKGMKFNMKIIGIGDLVVDYYFENNIFKGVCGGMTAFNVISHLAKDFETYAYGVCGDDFEAEIAVKSLEDVGVNIKYIKKLNTQTRCFYINVDKVNKVFTSKKSCPICGEKKWYETTKLNSKIPSELLSKNSILVLDTINKVNLEIVDKFKKKKAKIVLDMGQVGNFKYLTKDEILDKLSNRFDLVQLNERVALFLINKFKYCSYKELNNIFKCNLLIITHGKEGNTIVYEGNEIKYFLKDIAEEVDPSGAGDAFLSLSIKKYILNDFHMSEGTLNDMFEEASFLSSLTVQKLGARAVLSNLYDKNIEKDKCICGTAVKKMKKYSIKKTMVNLAHLKNRVNSALETGAYEKLCKRIDELDGTTVFLGTGGSKTPAIFASKVVNIMNGITTLVKNPRDMIYRNNNDIKNLFTFSYSGISHDILCVLEKNLHTRQFIITKGNEKKVLDKYHNAEIISYCKDNSNPTKERGFLSFEGVLSPCSLFARLYYEKVDRGEDFYKFFNEQMDFWNKYFEKYFKDENKKLKNILDKKALIDIFIGDYSECPGYDLESKIVESGVYRTELHEKKNFSHGRFVTLENFEPDAIIYFKNKNISMYEKKLLDYLSVYNDKLIIIGSEYDGILAEFDLLIAVQYFIRSISKLINVDLSKPKYSDDSMKIYKYKGEL